jgi:hypothetical protein
MKISAWLLISAVGLIAGGSAFLAYRDRPEALVTQALGTKTLPSSVRDLACKGWGVTDVLYTCTLTVDPKDFPSLLSGRGWSNERVIGGSHSFGSGPKVGRNFTVDVKFATTPADFPHGGSIWIVASPDRSHAQVDFYEE